MPSNKPRRLARLLTPLAAALGAGVIAFFVQAAAQTRAPLIESAPLTQLDGWSVGAMTRAQGALAPTLWERSDPAFLATLFDRVPTTFESPAARDLARRALVSGGRAPRGAGADEAMRKRFGALGRMGAADDLSQMAAGAGPAAADPAVAQYAAQAELARGRRPEACLRGRNANVEDPPPFLLRLRAFCAAAQGERAAADLALELARAANAEDAWLRGALSGIGPGAARPTLAARYDNSLNAAVSLAAGLRPGQNPLNGASTLALAALARASDPPAALKPQAVMLALRRGAIAPAEARAALTALPAEIPAAPGTILAALRLAQAQPGGLEAASAIVGVLRAATAPADFTATARILRDDIAALTIAPDAGGAILLARAALAAGDVSLAQRLAQNAASAGAPLNARAALEAALAIETGALDEAAIRRRMDGAEGGGARAAARDLALFAALGAPVDSAARGYILANAHGGGARADAALLAALAAAAAQEAVGETALIGAIIAAPGAGALDTASLTALIGALRAAGLTADARRLAIEAVLAGPPA